MKNRTRTITAACMAAAMLALLTGHLHAEKPKLKFRPSALSRNIPPGLAETPAVVKTFSSREEARRIALTMRRLKKPLTATITKPPNYAEAYEYTYGISGARANKTTGEVWLTAVGDGAQSPDEAEAGVKTNAFTCNGPGAMDGVTVSFAIDVGRMHSHEGVVKTRFMVLQPTEQGPAIVTQGGEFVKEPDKYSMTTEPFTMETGEAYYAVCYMVAFAPKKGAAATVMEARITDIEWKF